MFEKIKSWKAEKYLRDNDPDLLRELHHAVIVGLNTQTGPENSYKRREMAELKEEVGDFYYVTEAKKEIIEKLADSLEFKGKDKLKRVTKAVEALIDTTINDVVGLAQVRNSWDDGFAADEDTKGDKLKPGLWKRFSDNVMGYLTGRETELHSIGKEAEIMFELQHEMQADRYLDRPILRRNPSVGKIKKEYQKLQKNVEYGEEVVAKVSGELGGGNIDPEVFQEKFAETLREQIYSDVKNDGLFHKIAMSFKTRHRGRERDMIEANQRFDAIIDDMLIDSRAEDGKLEEGVVVRKPYAVIEGIKHRDKKITNTDSSLSAPDPEKTPEPGRLEKLEEHLRGVYNVFADIIPGGNHSAQPSMAKPPKGQNGLEA